MFVFSLFNVFCWQGDKLAYKWVRMWRIPKATLIVVFIRWSCIVNIWNKSDNGMFLHRISRFCLPKDTKTHPETRESSQLASVSQTRSDAFDFVITVIVRVLCRPTSGSYDRWIGIKRYSSISSDGNKWFTWTPAESAEGCPSLWCPKQILLHLNVYVLWKRLQKWRQGKRNTFSFQRTSGLEGSKKMMVTVWERLHTQYWC